MKNVLIFLSLNLSVFLTGCQSIPGFQTDRQTASTLGQAQYTLQSVTPIAKAVHPLLGYTTEGIAMILGAGALYYRKKDQAKKQAMETLVRSVEKQADQAIKDVILKNSLTDNTQKTISEVVKKIT